MSELMACIVTFVGASFLLVFLPLFICPKMWDVKSVLVALAFIAALTSACAFFHARSKEKQNKAETLYDSFISYSAEAEGRLDTFADSSEYIAYIRFDSDIRGDKYNSDGELIGAYTYDYAHLRVRFFDTFDKLPYSTQHSIIQSTVDSLYEICSGVRKESGYSEYSEENGLEYRFDVTLDTNLNHFGTYSLEDGKFVWYDL